MATLFTTQTPSTTDVNDGTGLNLGTGLKFSSAGQVTAIRFYASTTTGGTYTGALYQIDTDDNPLGTGTGTLLGSVTFGSMTGGTWNEATLASPISVNTTNVYKAVVFTSAGRYTATANFFDVSLTNGSIIGFADSTDYGFGSLRNGTFIVNGSLAYPNNTFNNASYFVDVQFTAGQVINVGIASETDSALTLAKAVNVGIASETDSALGLAKVVNVGLVSETDSALSIAATRNVNIGIVTETDSNFAVTSRKSKTLGIVNETDNAFPISRANFVPGPISYTINTGDAVHTVNTGTETFTVNTNA